MEIVERNNEYDLWWMILQSGHIMKRARKLELDKPGHRTGHLR